VINHSVQCGQHTLAERGPDHYSTPSVVVPPLLQAESLPLRIHEPCCGKGGIVLPLREAGRLVHASDLHEWGCPDSTSGIDFLTQHSAIAGCDAAVMNPPYKDAQQFIEHALELYPFVFALLRLAFLESARRSPLLDDGKLARAHIFANRLPMMHRANWDGPRASSAIAFAWFVFERDHRGPATIDRISWKSAV
jgi:hypothetical protein